MCYSCDINCFNYGCVFVFETEMIFFGRMGLRDCCHGSQLKTVIYIPNEQFSDEASIILF